MPKITKISDQLNNTEKFNIFIDGAFCVGIRKRTFQAMGLSVGSEISCEELKEKENFFWKQAYQKEGAWKKEKVRIDRVKAIVEGITQEIKVQIVGFGADSDELIKEHPDEKGKPDIDVVKTSDNSVVMKVEVTGTERLRGTGYWVRPDKLEYAENNSAEDVWIILHYAEPEEKLVFIRPTPGKKYERKRIEIREAGENMCIFNEGDEEVKTFEEFAAYLTDKLW